MKNTDKITTVEDSLEKAHHILAGMSVRYDLGENVGNEKGRAYWLFAQRESIDKDIDISIDYINKGLCELSSYAKGGVVNE